MRRLTACTHVGHIQSKYNSYNSYNARAPGLNAQTNDAVTDAESQMLLVVEQVREEWEVKGEGWRVSER